MARNGSTHNAAFTRFYSGNMLWFHSIITRYFGWCSSVCANFYNLFCGKSAIVVLLTMLNSSLAFCIKTICQLGVRCQVPRIYATRIVARMQKIKSFWNFSSKQFVSVAVSKYIFSAERYKPISSFCFSCHPNPTRFRLLDAIHKCFIRTDRRELIEFPCIPNSVIAIFAQSAAVRLIATLYAWRLDSLVSHISSCVHDYNINKGYCNA